MDLRAEIARTLVLRFISSCQSSGDGCGTASELSSFRDGSTNNTAAFDGGVRGVPVRAESGRRPYLAYRLDFQPMLRVVVGQMT